MKLQVLFVCICLLLLSTCATAGWQVSKPQGTVPREPFFQTGAQLKPAMLPSGYRVSSYRPPVAYKPIARARTYPYVRPKYNYANHYARYAARVRHSPTYAVSISGSLKENLERIMGRYHWKVIWKAPYDYNFDGRVTGTNLPNVVEKLLQPFPLQAVMYMSNRTLTVVPRMRT